MENREQQSTAFFDQYMELYNNSIHGKFDADETSGLYTDTMLVADPKGVFYEKTTSS